MAEKNEIEVKLRLPKALIDFLKAMLGKDFEKFLAYLIVDGVRAAIDAQEFTPSPEEIIEKHGLLPVFKTYDALPVFKAYDGRPLR